MPGEAGLSEQRGSRLTGTSVLDALEGRALRELVEAFGDGPAAVTASAPGRAALVGEHVDYVGGKIACVALDLELAVAVRPSSDDVWRVVSDGRRVERCGPSMQGDIGDRVFAAAATASEPGFEPVAAEVAVAATLPEAAGLSSSAAVVTASLIAFLRQTGRSVSLDELIDLATRAERDVVGVPCGPLDQRAVAAAPNRGVLVLDCRDNSLSTTPWPWDDAGLVVVHSGQGHDVAGPGYRRRRQEAEEVLRQLGVESCQDIGPRWEELADPVLRRRARHLASETRRTDQAVSALRSGDLVELGRLIGASHDSLRDDYQVSTPVLDAMVRAAESVPGCFGARLVGAGFGGSALALCLTSSAELVGEVMISAAGTSNARGWTVRPSAGAAFGARDVVKGEV
ncbi:MAG TPA: galactokinase family protein [Chloroflexota bacterium]|nr:galactokinase family protein [Chloroflexota bacterium]